MCPRPGKSGTARPGVARILAMSGRPGPLAVSHALLAVAVGLLAVTALGSSSGSLAAPSRSDLETAQARLHELESDFEIVVEEYDAARVRLASLSDRIEAAQAEVERLRSEIGSRRKSAVALASELYKNGGVTSALETVLGSASISDMESRVEYLKESENEQTKVFERLAVDEQALASTLRQLRAARAAVATTQQRLAQLKQTIESKLVAQRDEIERLQAAIARAERLRELRERRAEQRAERRAEAAAEKLRATPTQPDQSTPESPETPPPSPSSTPSSDTSSDSTPTPAASGGAATAVRVALAQVGKPYQWGAAGPSSFDCSGLTMYAWAAAGVSLPHSSAMQYSATTRVPTSALQAGDLLFYGSPIHHVAMYIGGGRMVEAPYSGSSVRVTSGVFRSDLVGAGRP